MDLHAAIKELYAEREAMELAIAALEERQRSGGRLLGRLPTAKHGPGRKFRIPFIPPPSSSAPPSLNQASRPKPGRA